MHKWFPHRCQLMEICSLDFKDCILLVWCILSIRIIFKVNMQIESLKEKQVWVSQHSILTKILACLKCSAISIAFIRLSLEQLELEEATHLCLDLWLTMYDSLIITYIYRVKWWWKMIHNLSNTYPMFFPNKCHQEDKVKCYYHHLYITLLKVNKYLLLLVLIKWLVNKPKVASVDSNIPNTCKLKVIQMKWCTNQQYPLC